PVCWHPAYCVSGPVYDRAAEFPALRLESAEAIFRGADCRLIGGRREYLRANVRSVHHPGKSEPLVDESGDDKYPPDNPSRRPYPDGLPERSSAGVLPVRP